MHYMDRTLKNDKLVITWLSWNWHSSFETTKLNILQPINNNSELKFLNALGTSLPGWKCQLYMTQTLFNLLFNIGCNGVQNLKILVDHLESQLTYGLTILKCFLIVHTYLLLSQYLKRNTMYVQLSFFISNYFKTI